MNAQGKNRNVVTRGGARTGEYTGTSPRDTIKKDRPRPPKMDPVKQKEYFHQGVDMFKDMVGSLTPPVVELSRDKRQQYYNTFKRPLADREPSGNSVKFTDLWLHLFSDILEDEQLTAQLCNTIKNAVESTEPINDGYPYFTLTR